MGLFHYCAASSHPTPFVPGQKLCDELDGGGAGVVGFRVVADFVSTGHNDFADRLTQTY